MMGIGHLASPHPSLAQPFQPSAAIVCTQSATTGETPLVLLCHVFLSQQTCQTRALLPCHDSIGWSVPPSFVRLTACHAIHVFSCILSIEAVWIMF